MKKIPAMVFSRTCGYFAMVYHGEKVGLWNKGKTEEYNERKMFIIPESILYENKKSLDIERVLENAEIISKSKWFNDLLKEGLTEIIPRNMEQSLNT